MKKAIPSSAKAVTEAKVPADLRAALAAAPAAQAAWKDLTPIARRDFISWIDTAKQAQTRARRIERAAENLVAGKRRPCCYAVVPLDFYKALGADPLAKAQWSDLDANERRNFVDWIEAAKDREKRKQTIEKGCAILASGKRQVPS
jgi:uncharacterized protein YdeI (YjbR/CyaY-like superfamily)